MNKNEEPAGTISRLSKKNIIKIVIAVVFTIGLSVSAGVYAWFNGQKKAAEMFKVEYPNSLFLNAAHREDRVFLDLGAIDVDSYEKDEYENIIYYKKTNGQISYLLDDQQQIVYEDGHPLYDKTDAEAHKITDRQYVFSVSGTGMQSFKLQLAHTTNNKFYYSIYEATQYTNSSAVPSGTPYVEYNTNKNSHNENQLQVAYDIYDDSANPTTLYYARGTQIAGEVAGESGIGYLNNNGYDFGIRNTNNKYYKETYGSYSVNNVHEDAMPLYCQTTVTLSNDEIDPNKGFCKYFILRVTWISNEQAGKEKKETDMIYISAKR